MIAKKRTNLPVVISLFCGAGGLDLGFEQAGFEVAVAIDYVPSFIETHKLNFKKTKSYPANLIEIGPEGVLSLVKKAVVKGELIGIIGGPPCQGFSRANPNSDPNDPRNLLPELYLKIIKKLQSFYKVEFVVFENVLGMKDKKHANKYNSLVNGLIQLGFDVNEDELCALDFGVAQKRRRIIISAMKNGSGYGKVLPVKKSGSTTVEQVIGGLQEPAFFKRGLSASEIPLHPNHWTMKPKSKRFNQELNSGNKTRSFRRLLWQKASPTIAFGNREIHIHPNGNRRISIYEAMLLQGFPKTFVLKGNFSEQVTQISNAVPPPLANGIAKGVKKSLMFNQ